MRISRIYNNNVALATNFKGEEIVVIGRGLTFGKRKGDLVDPSRVEQTFVPERGESEAHLTWTLSEIPAEILGLAVELEERVKAHGNFSISHSFAIPLADHLNYAIIRAREGITVEYPLALEVSQLYPQEVQFGQDALALVQERTGVVLPGGEAIPLALHLVNSQFTVTDMSQTYRMTEIFSQIFDLIATTYNKDVDQSSMSAARFVTHLRYLFVRTEKGGTGLFNDGASPAVLEAVRTSYPKAYACAQKVFLLLEMQLEQPLTQDELAYLTIHVARLAKELELMDS